MYLRLIIIFFLLISAGCKDKKPVGLEGISGGGLCSEQSGAPGDTVRCSVSDYKEGCVLFFAGRPVESSFNAATSEVEFVVPAIGGRFPVNMQCPGEGTVPVTQNFTVNIPLAGPHPVGEEPEGEEGVEPAPSEPEPEEEGREEPPPPPPQPAPRARPAPLTFVKGPNDSTALHATKLGLVRLKIRKNGNANLTQAYVYGPFNRLKEDVSCGLDSGHTLVVTPNGDPVNANDPMQRAHFGRTKCSERAPADEGCYNYNARENPFPFCRIDLENQPEVVLHTRFHGKKAPFVVVSQTGDGTFFTDRIEFEAPPPKLNNARVDVSRNNRAFKVSFDYENAAHLLVQNCQTAENFPAGDNLGSLQTANGTLNLDHCALKAKETDIIIVAAGLGGEENSEQNHFKIVLADPRVTLEKRRHECVGGVAWPHCRANIDLAPMASRHYDVHDLTDPEDIRRTAFGAAPWVMRYRLRYFDTAQRRWNIAAERNIATTDDAVRIFTTVRSHFGARWQLEAIDFGPDDRTYGRAFPGNIIKEDYTASFENFRPEVLCDGSETTVTLRWRGRHLRAIASQDCPDLVIRQPDAGNYEIQEGSITMTNSRDECRAKSLCKILADSFQTTDAGFTQAWPFRIDWDCCR